MADSSLETSPVAGARGGVKAFLENFATIVGAATVAILAMSLSHEYGYFWSVGRQFQTFLTTADYLLNSVLWLPAAAFFGWNRLKDVEPPKRNWKDWRTWRIPIAGLLALGVGATYLTWPLTFLSTLNVIVWLVIYWSYVWRGLVRKVDLEEPLNFLIRQLIRLGLPFIVAMFLLGSADAERDLTKFDEPYAFHFKNDDDIQLRIFMRNFDRGVLLPNSTDKKVEFRKWEDVVSITKPISDPSGPLSCALFHWQCGSRDIAGPL